MCIQFSFVVLLSALSWIRALLSCLAGAVSEPGRQLEATRCIFYILLRSHIHEFYRYVSGVCVNVVFGRVRTHVVAAAAGFVFARVCFKYRPNSIRDGLRLRRPLLLYILLLPALCFMFFILLLRVNV